MGTVLDVDCAPRRVAFGQCLRVRVRLYVTKPLRRGILLTLGEKNVVLCRYEKLSYYCYYCKFLDHLGWDCPLVYSAYGGSLSDNQEFGE